MGEPARFVFASPGPSRLRIAPVHISRYNDRVRLSFVPGSTSMNRLVEEAYRCMQSGRQSNNQTRERDTTHPSCSAESIAPSAGVLFLPDVGATRTTTDLEAQPLRRRTAEHEPKRHLCHSPSLRPGQAIRRHQPAWRFCINENTRRFTTALRTAFVPEQVGCCGKAAGCAIRHCGSGSASRQFPSLSQNAWPAPVTTLLEAALV